MPLQIAENKFKYMSFKRFYNCIMDHIKKIINNPKHF